MRRMFSRWGSSQLASFKCPLLQNPYNLDSASTQTVGHIVASTSAQLIINTRALGNQNYRGVNDLRLRKMLAAKYPDMQRTSEEKFSIYI